MVRSWPIAIVFSLSFIYAGEVEFGIEPLRENALPAQIMKVLGAADSLNRNGLAALEKKEYETALACFEKASDLLPGFSDARNNCGVVKFREGDIAGAREIWENLTAGDSSYAIGLFNLSLVQRSDPSGDSAIALLERAVRIDERFTEAWVRLGWAWLRKGEKGKALAVLAPAYKRSPKSPDVQSCYAFALLETGDTAGAVAVCRKHADNREAERLLGRIERSRGNYAAAAAALSQAEKGGNDPWLLPELADVQIDAKQYGEALAVLKSYFGCAIAHTADAWLLAGIAAKETGDLSASEDYFAQGSRAFPDDDLLRYNLGQVFFIEKKFDRAEAVWGSLKDSLADPSLLYLRAINADRRNDTSGAESFIRRALAIDDRPDFHAFLGKLLYRRGDRTGAAREFRAELTANPDLADARFDLALCEKSGPELDSAARLLERQFRTCAGDSCAEIALELSAVYYSSGAVDKAAGVLTSVKKKDRNEEVYRMLSRYDRELQHWNEAIDALETAVGKYVTQPQTDYDLAQTCLQAGFYEKAIGYYTRLLEKWPENQGLLYYQLGYAYLERNDLAQARRCLEQSLKIKGDNVAAKGLLAFVYNREGQVQGARELWRQTAAADSDNAALWGNLGLSYEKEGNYEKALADYKKAAAIAKNDPSLRISMGNCYAALGSTGDALACYKEALDSPKRDIAAYDMFLIHARKGAVDQADDALQILRRDFPASPYTKRATAEIALRNGDTAGALALLNGLPEKEPMDWVAMGRVYADKGETRKAEECLARVPAGAEWDRDLASVKMVLAFRRGDYREVVRSVLASGDTSFTARYNLALAYYQLERWTDALTLADTLASRVTGPDRADFCRLAGNAAFRLRQWGDALGWYLQLSDVESSNPVVLYNCAVASYNMGKYDDAYDYYSRARDRDSTLHNADIERRHAPASGAQRISAIDSLYNAGVALQNAGTDTVAEKLYDSVLARDSLYSMAWNNLGVIYGGRGEIDKAEKSYLKAVERRHDIPETYANLVNLYIQLEQYAKARQWLRRGEGYNPESDLWKDLEKRIVEAENGTGMGTNGGDTAQ
jgi:tetratricopeptide (TPR) repeat protein